MAMPVAQRCPKLRIEQILLHGASREGFWQLLHGTLEARDESSKR